MRHIFPSVTHSFKYDPFSHVWPIFSNVTNFAKCDQFFPVWVIFPSVTHLSRVAQSVSHWCSFLTLIDCITLGSAKFDLEPKPFPWPWPIAISQNAAVRSGKKKEKKDVDKKNSDRMDFLDANSLRVGNGRNPSVLPWLCLMKGRTVVA